jgi:hypothetical protein
MPVVEVHYSAGLQCPNLRATKGAGSRQTGGSFRPVEAVALAGVVTLANPARPASKATPVVSRRPDAVVLTGAVVTLVGG